MSQPQPRNAPGFRQLLPPPFGPVARLGTDALGFLLDGRNQFGDVFRFQVGPVVIHLISHPDALEHVLIRHARQYPRSWIYSRTRMLVGDGLVSTEGNPWRRLRRMSQPAFHPRRVASMAAAMTDETGRMLDRWGQKRAGTSMDVAEAFMDLTLRIAGRTLLSVDLGGAVDRLSRAVTTSLDYLAHRLEHPLAAPLLVPTPRNLRFRQARRTLRGLVQRAIHDRRTHPGDPDADLLAMLLAVRDAETGAALSDVELVDQILTFLGAGHETTAVGLAWTFYLLSQHADQRERMESEVDAALGDRIPNAADLAILPITRRVVEESLRLYPPVYAVARDAKVADVVGGFRIPRGSIVLISPYVTHRHPEVWPDPDRFDPDRFLPERSAGRPRLAWMPFLGGPHQCIGQEFAMMELVLVAAMVARRFRLTLLEGARVEPRARLSLRPRFGLPMVVEPRNSPA
jgi:cytochrome P450